MRVLGIIYRSDSHFLLQGPFCPAFIYDRPGGGGWDFGHEMLEYQTKRFARRGCHIGHEGLKYQALIGEERISFWSWEARISGYYTTAVERYHVGHEGLEYQTMRLGRRGYHFGHGRLGYQTMQLGCRGYHFGHEKLGYQTMRVIGEERIPFWLWGVRISNYVIGEERI